MDNVDGNGGSCRMVVMELSHIKKLVTQLEAHLGGCPDLCKHLTAQIFSIAERSIGMIMSPTIDDRKRGAAEAGFAEHLPSKNTKKRKTMEKRKHQVRVSSAGAGGNPVDDDGHSWRKYGQKEILGTKYPRGYYRCTHRHSQGCPATKQVQRTDDDPTLFDVIYHGEHTCVHKTAAAGEAAAATWPPADNRDAQSLTVKTEELAVTMGPQGWSPTTPFCFSSTPATGCLAPEHRSFSSPETPENWGVSPASSDSNQFVSFAPSGPTAECRAQSEYQEVVSALVAAVSAPEPAVDTDFADEFFNLDPSVENLDQSILSYFADP
ncbi:hypothetical protein ACP70R_006668 [Stipagrostis hirtigluma subsp. patula]